MTRSAFFIENKMDLKILLTQVTGFVRIVESVLRRKQILLLVIQ